jgi:hypothetical protein
MPDQTPKHIPPAADVRRRLAAANAEARYLRRLLRLARDRDAAKRLRQEAEQQEAAS